MGSPSYGWRLPSTSGCPERHRCRRHRPSHGAPPSPGGMRASRPASRATRPGHLTARPTLLLAFLRPPTRGLVALFYLSHVFLPHRPLTTVSAAGAATAAPPAARAALPGNAAPRRGGGGGRCCCAGAVGAREGAVWKAAISSPLLFLASGGCRLSWPRLNGRS